MRLRRVLHSVACTAVSGAVVLGGSARAAPTGTIRGTVHNDTTGRAQPGVEVRLVSGSRTGGGVIERTATTGRRGRFSFSALPTGRDRFYSVDALFRGGLFAGGVVTLPGRGQAPVIDTRLRVWETHSNPATISVARDVLFVLPSSEGDGVGVVESVHVDNTSDRAYIGRAPSPEAGTSPTLAFGLPAAADASRLRIVDASIDIPRIRPSELGFVTTVAIPPGKVRVTFTYPLEGATGQFDLTRRALYPIIDYSIHAARPLVVQSDELRSTGEVEIEGRTYARYSAPEPLAPGDVVQAVGVADAGANPVLLGGVAVLAVALVAGAVLALLTRRAAARRRAAPPPRTREALVAAVAELDLRHEAGEVDSEEWSRRRAELKARAAELEESHPAR
jgi:hypothetical protein